MSIYAEPQTAHMLVMEQSTTDTRIRRVDYDVDQHAVYAEARAMPASAIQRWMQVFGGHLPARRPLVGIDLGSGTGRFTPALAEAFGGPVYGVEPAARMRESAQAQAAHPQVRYLAGEAAAIPLPDAAADYVLMFLSFHHVPDRPAAAREIARVLKPGGRLILRTTFRGRVPDLWWRPFFPRSIAIEEAIFPSEPQMRALFEAAGFSTVTASHDELPPEDDLPAAAERLRLRGYSIFEQMTEAELQDGFAQMDAALAAGTIRPKPSPATYIVFAKPEEPAIA
jgi:ubiquinone/menaquinone biosynthesis C-methylase UbiE